MLPRFNADVNLYLKVSLKIKIESMSYRCNGWFTNKNSKKQLSSISTIFKVTRLTIQFHNVYLSPTQILLMNESCCQNSFFFKLMIITHISGILRININNIYYINSTNKQTNNNWEILYVKEWKLRYFHMLRAYFVYRIMYVYTDSNSFSWTPELSQQQEIFSGLDLLA